MEKWEIPTKQLSTTEIHFTFIVNCWNFARKLIFTSQNMQIANVCFYWNMLNNYPHHLWRQSMNAGCFLSLSSIFCLSISTTKFKNLLNDHFLSILKLFLSIKSFPKCLSWRFLFWTSWTLLSGDCLLKIQCFFSRNLVVWVVCGVGR